MKDPRLWIALVALMLATWRILAGVPGLFPARPPAVVEESIPEVPFVCRESGEVFRLRLTSEILEHPRTGRPTLVPAVYDARRKRWLPGPPAAVMHGAGQFGPQP